jgi:hypothetical protein
MRLEFRGEVQIENMDVGAGRVQFFYETLRSHLGESRQKSYKIQKQNPRNTIRVSGASSSCHISFLIPARYRLQAYSEKEK